MDRPHERVIFVRELYICIYISVNIFNQSDTGIALDNLNEIKVSALLYKFGDKIKYYIVSTDFNF